MLWNVNRFCGTYLSVIDERSLMQSFRSHFLGMGSRIWVPEGHHNSASFLVSPVCGFIFIGAVLSLASLCVVHGGGGGILWVIYCTALLSAREKPTTRPLLPHMYEYWICYECSNTNALNFVVAIHKTKTTESISMCTKIRVQTRSAMRMHCAALIFVPPFFSFCSALLGAIAKKIHTVGNTLMIWL